MVKADVAEDGYLGGQDDVRRVEFASHADLADDNVALLPREIFKADGRDHFKFGRLLEDGLRERLDVFGQGTDVVVGDHLAVDLNALAEFDDEGRGIKAGLIARGLEDRGQHGAGGAFAVRARDVDKFTFAFGVAHGVEQRGDALEAGDAALPADGVDIMQGFVKSHHGGITSFFCFRIYFFSRSTGGQSLVAVNTLER